MQPTMRFTVETGPHRQRQFTIRESCCLLGRGASCSIQLSGTDRDRLISRNHCRISIAADALVVEDLSSQNGTYVNGRKLSVIKLPLSEEAEGTFDISRGFFLTLGGTTLRIDLVHAEADQSRQDMPCPETKLDVGNKPITKCSSKMCRSTVCPCSPHYHTGVVAQALA